VLLCGCEYDCDYECCWKRRSVSVSVSGDQLAVIKGRTR
jgi:hypothetical protein